MLSFGLGLEDDDVPTFWLLLWVLGLYNQGARFALDSSGSFFRS